MKTRMMTLAAMLVVMTACEGPMGPVGPQGAQGVTGVVGPQGPQGIPGTASMVHTFYLSKTVNFTQRVHTSEMPTATCWVSQREGVEVWLDVVTEHGWACATRQEMDGSWSGAMIVPSAYVNSGWSGRIILVWTTS